MAQLLGVNSYLQDDGSPQSPRTNQFVSLLFIPMLAPRYTVELACGFGATVLLVVILIVVYHVYWLEMVLFYRAHFGTDETILGE